MQGTNPHLNNTTARQDVPALPLGRLRCVPAERGWAGGWPVS